MPNKSAYFQGGGGPNEPTPKKKKYKSDPALVQQPRFKEPLFHNYDLYETPGEHTPGGGFYQNMSKYDSVQDFIKKKRDRVKNKYKSDDSWKLDDGSVTKSNPIKARAALLNRIMKLAIDFPIDDQIGSGPILGDSGTYSDSVPIGGQLDEYLPLNDFEGKSPDKLDFGRDYYSPGCANCGFTGNRETGEIFDTTFPCPQCGKGGVGDKSIDLDALTNKYLNPAEPSIYGLPDGISPPEDLDAPNNENPQYGVTDSGNTLYDNVWF
jgi:hypothetical protein